MVFPVPNGHEYRINVTDHQAWGRPTQRVRSAYLVDHREGHHEVGQYLIAGQNRFPRILSLYVFTNLLVKVEVGQGQLYSLSNLLFLHIQTSDITVCNVRLFMGTEHSYGRVGFGGEYVNQRV